MTDDTNALPPQAFEVLDSPSYMERPITVTATMHMNSHHSMATKITLTRAEAYALVSALMLYLTDTEADS